MRNHELHSRFSQLVPQATRSMTALIAGAGMTGSWTALALARMVKEVHIWDFDTVEPANLGVQAYDQIDLHMNKALALAGKALGLPLTGHAERFPREIRPCDVLILAVDSMAARREIAYDAADQDVTFIIDPRILGEMACIHPVMHNDLPEYLRTLPTDAEVTNAPCGAQGTAFTGMWVASQICAIVNNFGRGLPLPPKLVWHVGLNQEIAP